MVIIVAIVSPLRRFTPSFLGFDAAAMHTVGAIQLHAVFELYWHVARYFEFRAYTRLRQLEHLISTRQIDNKFFWE